MGEVTVTKIYYGQPKRLPWDTTPVDTLPRKLVDFNYTYNGQVFTDTYGWYSFFTHFERIDGVEL